ncbi:MAG TPA: metalloregulator ArsR/SmtB family transcription factor [Rectinemataceae bacterium]|nr:metalloregulator ArsR/SmtB family transcription factor [Rectinemataceae bacterium]
MAHITQKAIDPVRIGRKAEIFAALASPARIAIVEALSQGELSVSELVEAISALECACSVERTNISKHLAVLRDTGIVSCHGDAQRRIYRLEAACLIDAIDCVVDRGNYLCASEVSPKE